MLIRALLVFSFSIIGAFAQTTEGSFALISPALAGRLPALAATPAGKRLLKTAEAGLTKMPDALPRVHTEGTLPHQGIYDESAKAIKDWALTLNFAMAYRLTGDARYLKATETYLTAWLKVYKPSFNPIDETNFDHTILAYDLTRKELSPETQEKMTLFLRKMAEGYLSQIGGAQSSDASNWQSHRIKLATLAAYALGDADLIARAQQAFQRQVGMNIKADASTYDFARRDALHYVVYDLQPLTVAAVAAKAHDGGDWISWTAPGGSSVEHAIDWLTPYALGTKTHVEYVHSAAAFDAARAKAGVPGFSGAWNPANSVTLYQLAALLDAKYVPILTQIPTKAEGRQDWLELVSKAWSGPAVH